MPRGRQTKLNATTQKRICDLVRKGMPRDRAARLAGVHPATFHRWMAEGETAETGIHRDFREAVCKAEDELVERAVQTATDLLNPRKCKEPSTRLNAAKFILSHRFSKEFSSRQEVTGADGGAVQVEGTVDITVRSLEPLAERIAAMSIEQLDALLGKLAT
jgi:hypothetical protein